MLNNEQDNDMLTIAHLYTCGTCSFMEIHLRIQGIIGTSPWPRINEKFVFFFCGRKLQKGNYYHDTVNQSMVVCYGL